MSLISSEIDVQSLTAMMEFNKLQNKVQNALDTVKTILNNSKRVNLPAEVPHQYDNKYHLSEQICRTSLLSQINCLEFLNISKNEILKLKKEAKDRSVSLRFKAEERCVFSRKEKKVDEGPTVVTEKKGILGIQTTNKTKVVTKIKQYIWHFESTFEIFAYYGTDIEKKKVFYGPFTVDCEIITTTKESPKPPVNVFPSEDVCINWIIDNIDENCVPTYNINRSKSSCRTPRRNEETDAALKSFFEFSEWSHKIISYFEHNLFSVPLNHGLDLSTLKCENIFIPIFALFNQINGNEKDENVSVILASEDIKLFLEHQKRTMDEKIKECQKLYPKENFIIGTSTSYLLIVLKCLIEVSQLYKFWVSYIESMLYQQLNSAIGKEVTEEDLKQYMSFHNRLLYKEQFRPKHFSYAVRVPNNSAEGVVNILSTSSNSDPQPIETISRLIESNKPMFISLNASTKISFYGEKYVHSYVSHRFEESNMDYSLNLRALQFSSFIVMVGTIPTSDTFEPTFAMIVKNRDEFEIPLEMNTIPSPKEFKDAIESLSPEQQRFCKAYRSLQLSSTLFGIVVIQIKPQMEKLLNIPSNSLTKEIQLTQDLMDLFITYQIPSDLLTFRGVECSTDKKIEEVKRYVTNMYNMIDTHRKFTLEEQTRIAKEEAARKSLLRNFQVKTLTGKTIPISARVNETIYDVKEKIQEIEGIPIDQIRIIFNSKVVENHEILSDLNVLDGSILHIVLRLRGGSDDGREVKSTQKMKRKKSGFQKIQASIKKRVQKKMDGALKSEERYHAAPTSSASMIQESCTNFLEIAVLTDTFEPEIPTQPENTGKEEKGEKGETKETEKKENIKQEKDEDEEEERLQIDITKIPERLESKFETLDPDSALRPTIISVGEVWEKKYYKSMLSKKKELTLSSEEQNREKIAAMDLLDALSRSGALVFDYATLHVVIASTHCFEKSIIDTVIQDNINPIEKLERSSLILSTTIHDKQTEELIQPEYLDKVSPLLLQG